MTTQLTHGDWVAYRNKKPNIKHSNRPNLSPAPSNIQNIWSAKLTLWLNFFSNLIFHKIFLARFHMYRQWMNMVLTVHIHVLVADKYQMRSSFLYRCLELCYLWDTSLYRFSMSECIILSSNRLFSYLICMLPVPKCWWWNLNGKICI